MDGWDAGWRVSKEKGEEGQWVSIFQEEVGRSGTRKYAGRSILKISISPWQPQNSPLNTHFSMRSLDRLLFGCSSKQAEEIRRGWREGEE